MSSNLIGQCRVGTARGASVRSFNSEAGKGLATESAKIQLGFQSKHGENTYASKKLSHKGQVEVSGVPAGKFSRKITSPVDSGGKNSTLMVRAFELQVGPDMPPQLGLPIAGRSTKWFVGAWAQLQSPVEVPIARDQNS